MNKPLVVVGFFLTWHGWSSLQAATDGDGLLVCCVPLLGVLIVLFALGAVVFVMLRGRFYS